MATWLRRLTPLRLPFRRARSGPDSSAWNPSGWWWCLEHRRVENPPDAPGHRRLGPYPSAADAEHWQERLDSRNETWDEEDRRWAGER